MLCPSNPSVSTKTGSTPTSNKITTKARRISESFRGAERRNDVSMRMLQQ